MEQFGINLFLCVAGLLGYSAWACRKHIKNRTFDWNIFLYENKFFWAWAGFVQLLYAIIMAVYPVLEEIIAQRIISIVIAAFGVQVDIPKDLVTVVVYLTLTWQLSRLINKSVSGKDKIGNKKVDN